MVKQIQSNVCTRPPHSAPPHDQDILLLGQKRGNKTQSNVYAGDVWEPQPPPKDHPWRSMPHNGMTPHYAGNTIDAQRRRVLFTQP